MNLTIISLIIFFLCYRLVLGEPDQINVPVGSSNQQDLDATLVKSTITSYLGPTISATVPKVPPGLPITLETVPGGSFVPAVAKMPQTATVARWPNGPGRNTMENSSMAHSAQFKEYQLEHRLFRKMMGKAMAGTMDQAPLSQTIANLIQIAAGPGVA